VQTEGKAAPVLPPKRGQLMMVPNGVRPQLQRTAIEVHVFFLQIFRKLSRIVRTFVQFSYCQHGLNFLIPNTHRRCRRDSTVELSRVGVVNTTIRNQLITTAEGCVHTADVTQLDSCVASAVCIDLQLKRSTGV